jgi:hypothetical protein
MVFSFFSDDETSDGDELDHNVQEAMDAESEDKQDDAKAAHNDETVKGVKGDAIREARAAKVIMTAKEEQDALGLFLKVLVLRCEVVLTIQHCHRSPVWLGDCMTTQACKTSLNG